MAHLVSKRLNENNKVALGGDLISLRSELIDQSYNNNFKAGLGNFTRVSLSNYDLEDGVLTPLPGTSTYSVSQDVSFTRGIIEFSYNYRKTASTSGTVKIWQVYIYGDDGQEAGFTFTVNDASLPAKLSYSFDDSTDNGNDDIELDETYYRGTIQLYHDGLDFYIYHFADGIHRFIGTFPFDNPGPFSQIDILSEEAGQSGTIEWRFFGIYPVISDSGDTSEAAMPLLVEPSNRPVYRSTLTYPATIDVTVYGLNSSEQITIQSVISDLKDYQVEAFISQPVEFYTDYTASTYCPVRGVSFIDESSLELHNRCFDDGSSLDQSEYIFSTKKSGSTSGYSNRTELPEYMIEEDGVSYGPSFEFNRIMQTEDMVFPTSSHRCLSSRVKKVSDNKIFVYGLVDAVNQTHVTGGVDFSFSLTYDWSEEQLDFPGIDIDEFFWEIRDEHNNVIESASDDPITISNYTDPGNIPTSPQKLLPGRYSFVLYSKARKNTQGLSRNTDLRGGRLRGEVEDSTYLVAEGMAEAFDMDAPLYNVREEPEWGICYINFEVKAHGNAVYPFVFELDYSTGSVNYYIGPDSDVSTRSWSYGLVSSGDGYQFFYMESDDDVYANRSRLLTSRSYVSGVGFTSEKTTYIIPGVTTTEYVHAFEIVDDEDYMYLFVSKEDDDDYVYTRYEGEEYRRSKPFTPCGDNGLIHHKLGKTLNQPNGANVYLNPERTETVEFDELSRALYPKAFNIGVNFYVDISTNIQKRWITPAHIRASFSPIDGGILLAVVDLDTRWPVLAYSGGDEFAEISIPSHHRLFQISRGYDPADDERGNTAIDVFSAVMHQDGMIYTCATSGNTAEIGIVDPAFKDTASPRLSEIIFDRDDYQRYEKIDFNYPDYINCVYSFMCAGDDLDSAEKIRLEINQLHDYMIVAGGSNVVSKSPLLYANHCKDVVPFETFSEAVYLPEHEGTQDLYQELNVSLYDYYSELQNLDGVESSVVATLEEGVVYHNRWRNAFEGYKVHARIKLNTNTSFPLTDTLSFYVDMISGESPDFYRLRARMLLNGNTAICQVYDNGSWRTAKTLTMPDTTSIYDLYILVKQKEEDSEYCIAGFFIKRFKHLEFEQAFGPSMNYANSTELFHIEDDWICDTGYATAESQYGLAFNTNTSGTDWDEFCVIYQLDHGLLRKERGFYLEVEEGPYTYYTSDLPEGRIFREMDDTRVLYHDAGSPDYGFKHFADRAGKLSAEIHIYNGFLPRMVGERMLRQDGFSLGRYTQLDTSGLSESDIHGFWITENDGSVVYIWADANDSNMDRFYADVFALRGANFRGAVIVGRDSTLDAWTEVATIDSDLYTFIADEYRSGTLSSISKAGMELLESELSYEKYFLRNNGNTHLIVDNDTDTITISNSGSAGIGQSIIYGNDSFKSLDLPIQYRYLGIKIPAQNVYEGYYVLDKLAFGKLRELDKHTSSGGLSREQFRQSLNVFEAATMTVYDKPDSKSFDFTFDMLTASDFAATLNIVEILRVNAEPLWIVYHEHHRRMPYLCYIVDAPTFSVIMDEDDQTRYTLTLKMQEVGESL